ncbi:MAG: ABC transporter ATP-binding protein [Candidatus Saccharimonadales bacterium]
MKKNENTTKQTLRLFWQFTRHYKFYFWAGTIGSVFGVVIQDIIPPILIASVFNKLQKIVNSGAALNLGDFTHYLYAYIGLLLLGVVIWRVQVWIVWQYEVRVINDLAVRIFNHLQNMGSAFHSNRFGGALVSQTNKFLGAYEKIMDEFTWSVVTGIVAFITSLVVLVIVYPLYAAIFGVYSVVYFLIMSRRTIKTMPYDRALAASESKRTAKLADMITNVAAVTTYAGEKYEKRLFQDQANETSKHYFKLLRKVMVNDSLSHLMTSGISITAFVIGVLAITVWHQPSGVLFLAVNYTMQMSRRLWESNRVLRNLNRAFGDATDMTHILNLQPEISDKPNAAELISIRGDIVFKNVDFGYKGDSDEKLFNEFALHIKPGEKIGLVGHSGGGKTTITKLLLRLMDIQGGQILIDGQSVSEVTQASLRRSIAYVPQEPLLFHRTLADNIAYGRPSASQAEIEAVSRLAHADEFISQLPEGYDTLVGERGVKLSGGQRQRVAIARAMLKNAPILVLDEATSALDSESEVLIQDALWKLMEGRTAIVIAHRLSTIQKMDRIIVIENGRIAEQGSHKDLIRQDGIYAKLWAHQSGGFIEE